MTPLDLSGANGDLLDALGVDLVILTIEGLFNVEDLLDSEENLLHHLWAVTP